MDQTKDINDRHITWVDGLSLFLSLCGALVAVYGAVSIYVTQVETFQPISMWPLPGLALLYWLMLGIGGLVISTLATVHRSVRFIQIFWSINGAFIPLILLGAVSFGFMVFIGFVFFYIFRNSSVT